MASVSSTRQDDTLGTLAVALGVAGLLPVLPFIGSIAALVCGYLDLHQHPGAEGSGRARAGTVLGWIGVAAPVVFLFVYCVVLGYPFPIHRHHS